MAACSSHCPNWPVQSKPAWPPSSCCGTTAATRKSDATCASAAYNPSAWTCTHRIFSCSRAALAAMPAGQTMPPHCGGGRARAAPAPAAGPGWSKPPKPTRLPPRLPPPPQRQPPRQGHSMETPMLETENALRTRLASLYRLLAFFRMTDLIDTHISARIPGTANQFLINRYGVLFHQMQPQDLIRIDPEGQPIDAPDAAQRVNAAGFTIPSPIPLARHDLACVIHTHT